MNYSHIHSVIVADPAQSASVVYCYTATLCGKETFGKGIFNSDKEYCHWTPQLDVTSRIWCRDRWYQMMLRRQSKDMYLLRHP